MWGVTEAGTQGPREATAPKENWLVQEVYLGHHDSWRKWEAQSLGKGEGMLLMKENSFFFWGGVCQAEDARGKSLFPAVQPEQQQDSGKI